MVEIKEMQNKEPATIANIVEQTWLARYPRPEKVIYDQGKAFLGEFSRMIMEDYHIKQKPITTRNPLANSVLERVHQTIGNIIRTFEINDQEVDEDDPFSGILSATMFAIRATYHTTLKATPMQLVFGRDAFLNKRFRANWKEIKNFKQRRIAENNQKENAKRIEHQYKKGELILFKNKQESKFGQNPYSGPYKIRQVNNNGAVTIKKGVLLETINMRLIKPYVASP